jgi:HNH endonuclease
MAFHRVEVSELLSRCHRRCCICHRFCGVKIETDHIVPAESGGSDHIDNAIPVCFECHAEIHSYNEKHPRGRKFLPEELQLHKAQWLTICAERPDLLIAPTRHADVGPLQALIDELDFNSTVAEVTKEWQSQGCRFKDQQFLRAIHEGSVSLLRDNIRELLLEAYRAMGSANAALDAKSFNPIFSDHWTNAKDEAQRVIMEARPKIAAARSELLKFLSNDAGRNGSEGTDETSPDR